MALDLFVEAAEQPLLEAGITADEVDAIATVSLTGSAIPKLLVFYFSFNCAVSRSALILSIADLHTGEVCEIFKIIHDSTFFLLIDFISAGQSLRASLTQAFFPGSDAANEVLGDPATIKIAQAHIR